MVFYICLAVAALVVMFGGGALGLSLKLAITLCIIVVIVMLVVKHIIIPIADSVVEGHDPFGGNKDRGDA